MSENSAIEWTDATWNPVRGCVKVSPGCANCYAETFAERFRGVKGHAYEQGFDLRLVPEKLTEPLKWKKPRRVFVNSMSDLFQDGVPDSYIDQVFAVMALCSRHTFQVLTKRSIRMQHYVVGLSRSSARIEAAALKLGYSLRWKGLSLCPWPLPNVWLGVSVENQAFLYRIDALKDTPAIVRFVSFEPLLEDLGRVLLDGIQWAIVGGESGHGSRPFNIQWGRSLVEQCKDARVPVFVKQLGSQPIEAWADGPVPVHRVRFKSRKGGDMAEWPQDLRVREFPPSGQTGPGGAR